MWKYLRLPWDMAWRTSRWFVFRELWRWRWTNKIYTSERYGFGQGLMISIGRVPRKTAFELCALLAILVIDLMDYMPSWPFPAWSKEDKHAELVAYFSSPWVLQGTIVALTFPIVVVLVAFLFQRRGASDVRLRIYLGDSCALVVTVSSLALVLCLALQYVMLWLDDRYLVEWVLFLDIAWFSLNVFGTIYFLCCSFAFLVPEKRAIAIRRYVFTVIWPDQVTALYKQALLGEGDAGKAALPKAHNIVHFGSNWARMGDHVMTQRVIWRPHLNTVYFSLVEWAALLWRRQVTNPAIQAPPSIKRRASLFRLESKLLLPVDFGSEQKWGDSVIRVTSGKPPEFVARSLLWLSLTWTSKEIWDGTRVEHLVDEMQGDVVEALYNRRLGLFETNCNDLVQFIILMIRASEYTVDNKKRNFATMQDTKTGRPPYLVWAESYLPVFEASTRALKDDEAYFKHASTLPFVLFMGIVETGVIDIKFAAMNLYSTIWWVLGKWWNRAIEDQGTLEHGPCATFSLNPPLHSVHRAALNAFIGDYETLRYALPALKKVTFGKWDAAQETARLHMRHLGLLENMIFSSLNRGDELGARAATDMLMNWGSFLTIEFGGVIGLPLHGWEITVNDVLRTSEADAQKITVDAEDLADLQGQEAVALAVRALKNFWQDLVFIATTALMLDSQNCAADNPLSLTLAHNLMKGERPYDTRTRMGGGVHVELPRDILQMMLRQFVTAGSIGDYGMVLDQVRSGLYDVEYEPLIAMRVYGSYAKAPSEDKVLSMALLYLMTMTNSPWDPARELADYFAGVASKSLDRARRTIDFIKKLVLLVESPEFDETFNTYRRMSSGNSRDGFDLKRADLLKRLHALVAMMDATLTRDLVQAKIDPDRLIEVATWASRSAFSPARSVAPVSMFRNAEVREDIEGKEIAFAIHGLGRGEFVKTQDRRVAANEAEMIDVTTRDRVAIAVMSDLILGFANKTVPTATPDSYWDAFKRTAAWLRKQRKTPVLLIEVSQAPFWMRYWLTASRQHGIAYPDDLRLTIERPKDGASGYLGTINDVQVYQAYIPRGMSYMVPADMFELIQFKKFSNQLPVEASVPADPNNPRLVNLTIKWAYKVDIDPAINALVTRFLYGDTTKQERPIHPGV